DDYRLEDVLLEALDGLDGPIALGLSSGHTAHPNRAPALRGRAPLAARRRQALAGLDGPIALGLSSGHTAHPNVTLPFGVRARLECRSGEARFSVLEAPVEGRYTCPAAAAR